MAAVRDADPRASVGFLENMKQIMRNRKLNRLKNYDYTQNGFYFVTVCTKGRAEWFGEIRNERHEFNKEVQR